MLVNLLKRTIELKTIFCRSIFKLNIMNTECKLACNCNGFIPLKNKIIIKYINTSVSIFFAYRVARLIHY